MLSHGLLGFSGGLLAAGFFSDTMDGSYGFVYLSAGGIILLAGFMLLLRDVVAARERA